MIYVLLWLHYTINKSKNHNKTDSLFAYSYTKVMYHLSFIMVILYHKTLKKSHLNRFTFIYKALKMNRFK